MATYYTTDVRDEVIGNITKLTAWFYQGAKGMPDTPADLVEMTLDECSADTIIDELIAASEWSGLSEDDGEDPESVTDEARELEGALDMAISAARVRLGANYRIGSDVVAFVAPSPVSEKMEAA